MYELASEVAGGPARPGRIVGRRTDSGRTLTFVVPAALRANPRLTIPLLVVSNGGPTAVAYAVRARWDRLVLASVPRRSNPGFRHPQAAV